MLDGTASFLSRARGLDPHALSEIFDAFYPSVLGYVGYFSTDRAQAETMAAEVFRRMATALANGRIPAATVGYWLYGVCDSVIADTPNQEPAAALGDDGSDSQEHTHRLAPFAALHSSAAATNGDALAGAVAELPDDLRRVVALCYGFGVPVDEAARFVGMPVEAVREARALAMLRLAATTGTAPGVVDDGTWLAPLVAALDLDSAEGIPDAIADHLRGLTPLQPVLETAGMVSGLTLESSPVVQEATGRAFLAQAALLRRPQAAISGGRLTEAKAWAGFALGVAFLLLFLRQTSQELLSPVTPNDPLIALKLWVQANPVLVEVERYLPDFGTGWWEDWVDGQMPDGPARGSGVGRAEAAASESEAGGPVQIASTASTSLKPGRAVAPVQAAPAPPSTAVGLMAAIGSAEGPRLIAGGSGGTAKHKTPKPPSPHPAPPPPTGTTPPSPLPPTAQPTASATPTLVMPATETAAPTDLPLPSETAAEPGPSGTPIEMPTPMPTEAPPSPTPPSTVTVWPPIVPGPTPTLTPSPPPAPSMTPIPTRTSAAPQPTLPHPTSTAILPGPSPTPKTVVPSPSAQPTEPPFPTEEEPTAEPTDEFPTEIPEPTEEAPTAIPHPTQPPTMAPPRPTDEMDPPRSTQPSEGPVPAPPGPRPRGDRRAQSLRPAGCPTAAGQREAGRPSMSTSGCPDSRLRTGQR